MRIAILLSLFFVAGCAQLAKGEAPGDAKPLDAANKLMVAECNGLANDWADCYHAANKACPGGYVVTERTWEYGSITRKFIFKCN